MKRQEVEEAVEQAQTWQEAFNTRIQCVDLLISLARKVLEAKTIRIDKGILAEEGRRLIPEHVIPSPLDVVEYWFMVED